MKQNVNCKQNFWARALEWIISRHDSPVLTWYLFYAQSMLFRELRSTRHHVMWMSCFVIPIVLNSIPGTEARELLWSPEAGKVMRKKASHCTLQNNCAKFAGASRTVQTLIFQKMLNTLRIILYHEAQLLTTNTLRILNSSSLNRLSKPLQRLTADSNSILFVTLFKVCSSQHIQCLPSILNPVFTPCRWFRLVQTSLSKDQV